MSERIKIDKANQIVLLYSEKKLTWEDQTYAITAMYEGFYYGNFTGYNVYLKGVEKKLFYKAENVDILNLTEHINIEHKDVYVNGELTNATQLDRFQKDYFRVHIGSKKIVTRNIKLKENKYKDIIDYYYDLAEYAGTIAEEDSPLYFLAQNYKRITPVKESIFYDFARGVCKTTQDHGHILVPFDFNQSQIKAIREALNHNISVIEGPPGTGKTQTILNLIANLIFRGFNCAIVSNNNTAIDNIYEKLEGEGLSFFAAALGRKSNVQTFFESNSNEQVIDFLKKEKTKSKTADSVRIAELSSIMKNIQTREVNNAVLEMQLNNIENEQKHFNDTISNQIVMKEDLSSSDYLSFINQLETPKKIGFIKRWLLGRKFKIKLKYFDLNTILASAEKLYYNTKIKELNKKISDNTAYLVKHNKTEINHKLKALCRIVFEEHIHNHYVNVGINDFKEQTYKHYFQDFIKRFPVVLSTSQSVLNNAPKGFSFDYLIIDEASQGDLLSSVLAMNSAKNLVVVGDSRQLQQIEEERLFEQSRLLAQKYSVPKAYQYQENSILMSTKKTIKNVPSTLLREHYRCKPDIIQFCNKMFYDGQLVPMTKNDDKHIEIIKTVPGNHARKNPYGSGLYNQREIDEIEHILENSKVRDIGVITPFRYQAKLITERYHDENLEADTIHKFQGREKSEIILSFVVNDLNKNPEHIENKLYDFVTNKKLLNVAISRSQHKITAIVSDKVFHSQNNIIKDFIDYTTYLYGSNMVRESTITSIFDYLYSEHTAFLLDKYKNKPKEHKTELLMSDLIKNALLTYTYIGYAMHTRLSKIVKVPDTYNDDEKKYISHPWTHVDFLFYNNVSKAILFVLEVDGIQYHEQDNKQAIHDEIKNRVLKDNNVPMYRFKTNESNEKYRLEKILEEFAH